MKILTELCNQTATEVKFALRNTPHRFGDIKDAPDVKRGVGAVVQSVAWLVVSLSDVAVELLVLPVTDLLRLHHPQSLKEDRQRLLKIIIFIVVILICLSETGLSCK